MNFTCTGRILKLFFVANRTRNNGESLKSPEFYLEREYCRDPADADCEYQWLTLNQRIQHPKCLHARGGVGLYEIVLSSNNTFNSGDILGVHHPTPDSNNSVLTILYQNGGGYYDTLNCNRSGYTYTQEPILPYIAIETMSGSKSHSVVYNDY